MQYKFRKIEKIGNVLLSVMMLCAVAVGTITGAVDYSLSKQRIPELSTVSQVEQGVPTDVVYNQQLTAKLFGVPLKNIDVDFSQKQKLFPGGGVFGVKFFTKGVIVVGMSDVESTDGILNPAYTAGLRVGDTIIKINGIEVNTVEELGQYIESFDGNELEIEYDRDGINMTSTLLPVKALSDGKYKSGLWVRDSTAGIGTVTYYNPDTGDFGGLGHGICDVDTGKLMPMLKGNIVDITVKDIVKGLEGEPGEIKGSFGTLKKGSLNKNSEEGVFGRLYESAESAFEEPLEISSMNEVHEGEAFLYSSLGDEVINKYSINLVKIYHNGEDTKNFIFKVTDKNLLERTGGIIQGMSGSPIVQDGKLVGAVTHVMVNDPTKGYGIFIENMLEAAENGVN